MKKLRVGITGGIGSGKSLVARQLHRRGAPLVDMDKAGRWAVEHDETVASRLRQAFGERYFVQDGGLLRRELGARVFSDRDALERLNQIVHPAMLQRVRECMAAAELRGNAPYMVLDAALVYELNFDRELDIVVVVCAPWRSCLERVQRRSGLSELEFMQRCQAQMPVENKRSRADYVIDNDGSVAQLTDKVDHLHQWLLQRCAGR